MEGRVTCRNCECSQTNGPSCRRCGRPFPNYQPPPPAPPPEPTPLERFASAVALITDPWPEIERVIILARIAKYQGSVLAAARSLGMGKTSMYRKLREYGAPLGRRNELIEWCQNGTRISESTCNQNATVQR